MDESGGPVEGGVAFFEVGGECLEDVRDAGGDVQDDGHVVGGGLGREAGGVVEEHLVSGTPAWISGGREVLGEVGEDGADLVGWPGSVPARWSAALVRMAWALMAGSAFALATYLRTTG